MKENLIIKYIVLFCLLSPLMSFAQEVVDSTRKVVFLKNGSILKGQIIQDTEFNLIIVTDNQDTLDYSYKYVQSVKNDTPEAYADMSINLIKPKYQKTTGVFLNLDISVIPISLQMGHRITPSLNVGGQVSLIQNNNDLFYGLSAYGKYFFSKDQSKSKLFSEFYIGVVTEEQTRNESRTIDPYAGIGVGIHLASRKQVRFYFKLGAFTIRKGTETIIRSGASTTLIKSNIFDFYPQLTLLGIEF